jgi:TPR repeat/Tetratricopeptide repeat
MNRNLVIAAAGGLLVGTLLGYTIGLSKGVEMTGGRSPSQLGQDLPPGGMPAGAPGGMPPGLEMPPGGQAAGPAMLTPQQRTELEAQVATGRLLVQKDPKNAAAWIAIGNACFDLNRVQESIEAYDKALALQPANPDVLTDQGAMYERAGELDKALANFEKAQKINPSHIQSLFNMGVIYERKNDSTKAAATWKKVVDLAPNSPQAAQAREGLKKLGR